MCGNLTLIRRLLPSPWALHSRGSRPPPRNSVIAGAHAPRGGGSDGEAFVSGGRRPCRSSGEVAGAGPSPLFELLLRESFWGGFGSRTLPASRESQRILVAGDQGRKRVRAFGDGSLKNLGDPADPFGCERVWNVKEVIGNACRGVSDDRSNNSKSTADPQVGSAWGLCRLERPKAGVSE